MSKVSLGSLLPSHLFCSSWRKPLSFDLIIKALDNVKGVILNGGENRIVDGEAVVVLDEIYGCGYPVISVDYPQSKCEVQYAELPNDEVMKDFLFNVLPEI